MIFLKNPNQKKKKYKSRICCCIREGFSFKKISGVYFKKQRARVIIGKPFYASELYDSGQDYKTNLNNITQKLRENILSLEKLLEEKTNNEKAKEKN